MTDLTAGSSTPTTARRGAKAALLLLLLVAGADLLLWHAPVGLNLFVLFFATGVAVILLRRSDLAGRGVAPSLAVWVASLLPLIETPSWTGFLCALGGTSLLALALSKRLPRAYEDLTATLLRFGLRAPFRLPGDVLSLLGSGASGGAGRGLVRRLLTWVVPAILAAAFLVLFAEANPLIEAALQLAQLERLLDLLNPERVIFWGFVAVVAWPLLRPRLLAWPKNRPVHGPHLPAKESVLFGHAAILRSLVLFNVLFAVQTVSDALYLWGGVRLPEGLSYADYAHRGAYPLIVTALLAAGFVLAAMRPNGAASQSPLIRRLVFVFLAQNVGLVLSSILRLDLYVKVYSLTELRLAAGIWMGLVAVGLVLILVRIVLRRSNAWLITSNLVALGLTLYAYSFVDVPALVAGFNIENSREMGGEGQPLDVSYLGELGPSALPAIIGYLDRLDEATMVDARAFEIWASEQAAALVAAGDDWRGWSFRNARLRAYLAGNPHFAKPSPAAINGEATR